MRLTSDVEAVEIPAPTVRFGKSGMSPLGRLLTLKTIVASSARFSTREDRSGPGESWILNWLVAMTFNFMIHPEWG